MGFLASGQRTITDQIDGAETVNFTKMLKATQVQALCTEVGGTSDGTLRLHGSVDGTSWEELTETSGVFHFFPNDTFTISDGGVWLVSIKEDIFNYYKVVGSGTSSDTTSVTIKYERSRGW